MAKKEEIKAAPGQTVVVVKEKKSLLAKIFGFGCLGIVVIIIIVAVATSKGGSSTSTSSGSSGSSSSQQKSEYAVGEAVKQDDITLTVTDVQRNYSTGNEFDKPESGKELVRVNVKLENGSKTSASYSDANFKIQDSTGNRLYTTFTTVPNALSSAGELAPGGSVTGNIVFTVPRDDKGLKLIFDGSFWSSEITIKL